MPKTLRYFLFLSALLLAVLACGESGEDLSDTISPKQDTAISQQALPKGERTLELDVNPSQNGDYDQAIEHARQLGAESIRLSVFWDELEPAPGVFNPEPNWLAIANDYYPAQGFRLSLVIAVLDTTEIRLPQDLQGKPLDHPEVIARFQDLLDDIATQIPGLELTSLAIGNEIDGVLGADPDAWAAYQAFYAAGADHARSLWPGVPVGTKVQFEGLLGPSAGFAQSLNQSSDVIMTTYYPLQDDFSVREPAVIKADFQRLVEAYPEREIQITEIGYPSGEANGSSPQKQAEFIRHMFSAWDDHAEQITLLSYSWLTDLSGSSVKELSRYYGLSNRAFGEFLRTLGLRTYPGKGKNKPGYQVFEQEAAARGWE